MRPQRPWTPEEDALLYQLRACRTPYKVIARKIPDRTWQSVKGRLRGRYEGAVK